MSTGQGSQAGQVKIIEKIKTVQICGVRGWERARDKQTDRQFLSQLLKLFSCNIKAIIDNSNDWMYMAILQLNFIYKKLTGCKLLTSSDTCFKSAF